jgi:hypothetical protein
MEAKLMQLIAVPSLGFRHWGAARKAWRAQRVIDGGNWESCGLLWLSHGGKAGRVLLAGGRRQKMHLPWEI